MLAFRKTSFLLLACSLMAVLWASTAAAMLLGDSRTYLRSWESLDSERHNDLYQYLDIDLDELGVKGLSFSFGGWGRASLGKDSYGESSNGEFQYGYLNYAHGKGNIFARLGRLYVSEGVALQENLDGVHLGGDLAHGLSYSVYGGVPIETDEDGRGSDYIYGGRLSLAGRGTFEIGASYLREDNDSSDFREEAGVDLFIRLGNYVQLDGESSFNIIDSSWADHDYQLVLGTWKGWRFTGDIWKVDYSSYFQSPLNSAFFSPLLDLDESLLLAGGELSYAITPAILITGTYQSYGYDNAGNADAWGGRLDWTLSNAGVGLMFRRVDGSTAFLRYSEFRGYATRRFGAWDITLDALDVIYDEKINDVEDAYALVAAVGYNFSDSLRLVGDVEYASNPFFEEDVSAFVKLLWGFAVGAPAKGGN